MTLLEDRPETEAPDTESSMTDRVFNAPTSSWRFASRLARREVRRRPGRTILVMLLVIIPVIGMTVADIVYRTSLESRASLSQRQYGTADLFLSPITDVGPDGEIVDPTTTVFGPNSPQLPIGSTSTSYVQAWTPMSAEVDGVVVTRSVLFTDVDLTDPITAGTVEILDGRAPTGPGDVLLSAGAAQRFGVELGDEFRFVRPAISATVVGIGRDTDSYGTDLVVATGFDRNLLRNGAISVQSLVDLPDTVTEEQVQSLTSDFVAAGVAAGDPGSRFYYDRGQTGRELAWGWVGGVVSLVAVGIVIAAAFATSARRQLVTIGQLSANGAPERLVRRTMGLQGLWTGLLGAVSGVVVASVGMLIAHRTGLIERFANSRVGSASIVPLDLIVIVVTAAAAATVAALIPARSAARVPVLSALAGRRPVSTPPSWMAPVGIVSFLVGLFLLGGSASVENAGDFEAMLALIGSLCVLGGIVCASPLIVAAVGNVGSRAGGVVRLAARSLGRSRSRSSAVLTAIATVGALATVGATLAPTAYEQSYDPDFQKVTLSFNLSFWPGEDEAISLEQGGVFDPPPIEPTTPPAGLRQDVERVLPDATWTPVTHTVDDPLPYRVATGETVFPDGYNDGEIPIIGKVAVDDPGVRSLLNLNSDQEQILDETGVLGIQPYLEKVAIVTSAGPVVVDLSSSIRALGFSRVPQTDVEYERANTIQIDPPLYDEIIVSQQFVDDNGLTTAVDYYVIQNPTELTAAERDAMSDLQPDFYGADAFVARATAPGFEAMGSADGAPTWYPSFNSPSTQPPEGLIQLAVIVASLLLVLGVVAIGLSLAATESRDERDVLHAVGASPKTLRRVSAAKAWVLTTGAAVVAVPAGYITIFVITRAIDTRAPFPFIVAAALLVGIPLIAAGSTMVVSALAQRFRPVTYSTIAID